MVRFEFRKNYSPTSGLRKFVKRFVRRLSQRTDSTVRAVAPIQFCPLLTARAVRNRVAARYVARFRARILRNDYRQTSRRCGLRKDDARSLAPSFRARLRVSREVYCNDARKDPGDRTWSRNRRA